MLSATLNLEFNVAQALFFNNEEQAKGIEVKAVKLPFPANGRALALNITEGFVKLVAHKEDGLLVGAQIVSVCASDMIAELSLAIEAGMTTKYIALTIHAHPTFWGDDNGIC